MVESSWGGFVLRNCLRVSYLVSVSLVTFVWSSNVVVVGWKEWSRMDLASLECFVIIYGWNVHS